MWRALILHLAPLFCCITLMAFTEPKLTESGILQREEISEYGLVFLELKNGMKVCLKKTESQDEILIRLAALGGYASLPNSDRASGQFASQIAIRSGIGNYQFDQLHAMLYDHSLEFHSEVKPFCRYIEGSAFAGDIDVLMHLINLFFTDHHFSEQAFHKIIKKTKEEIIHRNKKHNKSFDKIYWDFNIPHIPALKRLTLQELDKAQYKAAKKIFDTAFHDPSEFAVIIAGAFDNERMIDYIEKYLASIPKRKECKSLWRASHFSYAFKGIKTKVVTQHQGLTEEAITVLTFPTISPVNRENFTMIERLAKFLQKRLKKVLREKYGMDTQVVNVSTELPFYPCLSAPWIKIQYFTNTNLVTPIGQTILSELRKMQERGVSVDEVNTVNRKFKKNQRLHETDNDYWIMILSNYLLWNWNLTDLPNDFLPLKDNVEINKRMQRYFSLNNYTLISLYP